MRWKTGDKTYGLQKPTQHFVSQKRCIRFMLAIPFSTAPAGLTAWKDWFYSRVFLFRQIKTKGIILTNHNPVKQSELVAKHVTGAKDGKYVWRDNGTFGFAFLVPDLVKKLREIQL